MRTSRTCRKETPCEGDGQFRDRHETGRPRPPNGLVRLARAGRFGRRDQTRPHRDRDHGRRGRARGAVPFRRPERRRDLSRRRRGAGSPRPPRRHARRNSSVHGSARAAPASSSRASATCPELFIALFALRDGLVERRPGGARRLDPRQQRARARGRIRRRRRSSTERSSSARSARAACRCSPCSPPRPWRSRRSPHEFHAPAAAHSEALSLICAGVLLVLYVRHPAVVPAQHARRGARACALDDSGDGGRPRPRRHRGRVHVRLVRDRADACDPHAAHERGVRRPRDRRDRGQRRRERRRDPAGGPQQDGLRGLGDRQLVAADRARADAGARVRVAALHDAPDARLPDAARARACCSPGSSER